MISTQRSFASFKILRNTLRRSSSLSAINVRFGSLSPFSSIAGSGGFGSAAAAVLATRFSVLLGFTAPQMTRIKTRIPTQADFIPSLVSSCSPPKWPRAAFAPGPKSAYGTKTSIDLNQCAPATDRPLAAKKNSVVGNVADSFQRAIPHFGDIAHPLFRTLNDNLRHPLN